MTVTGSWPLVESAVSRRSRKVHILRNHERRSGKITTMCGYPFYPSRAIERDGTLDEVSCSKCVTRAKEQS